MKTDNRSSGGAHDRLRILHIVLSIGPTSSPYNEHCLPMSNKRDISICTYFPSNVTPPATIHLFEGDASIKGFLRTLNAALDAKEYDVVHAHTPHVALLSLLVTLFRFGKSSASDVVTVHDSYPNYKWRNRLLFLPVFACFRRVVCCSHASFASFPAVYKWLAGRRLTVVQNAMDLARVDRMAAAVPGRSLNGKRFTVAAVSRLVAIKNPLTLLNAFHQGAQPANRLIYIGEGPLRPSLAAASRQMGIENQAQFTGLIAREQVYEHLLHADLFVSVSRGEGLPLAVMEAMACGCPVLLSDIPPHREIAAGADFIQLIDPDDVVGFAREIARFERMAAPERIAIGSRCRKLVEDKYSLTAMHENYERVYHEITDCKIS